MDITSFFVRSHFSFLLLPQVGDSQKTGYPRQGRDLVLSLNLSATQTKKLLKQIKDTTKCEGR